MSSVEYINSIVLSSTTANITFSNIPQYYQDLIIIANCQINDSGQIAFTFNSNSSSYSSTVLYANGSSVGSTRYSNNSKIEWGATGGNSYQSGIYTPYEINILGYSNTSIFKTALISMYTANSAFGGVGEISSSIGMWRQTEAINSITLTAVTSTSRVFNIGTTFSLWGLR